jgi:hypothetical protein
MRSTILIFLAILIFATTPARAQGTAWEYPGRAHVRVLIERLANRQSQAPESYVVGNVRRTDGTEKDGIEITELVRPTFGHHDAVFLVVVRTPVKILELEFESAVAFGTDLQHLHTTFTTSGPIPSPPIVAIL